MKPMSPVRSHPSSEYLRGFVRAFPVTLHHLRATDADFAHLANGKFVFFIIKIATSVVELADYAACQSLILSGLAIAMGDVP
jgi:hypothetical protein